MTVVHILTVGTSLLGNTGGEGRDASTHAQDVLRLNEACLRVRGALDEAAGTAGASARPAPRLDEEKDEIVRRLCALDPRQEVSLRRPRGAGRGPRDRLPQEASYLALHHDAHPTEPKARCHLLASGTPAGRLCADVLREYINRQEWLSRRYEASAPVVIPGLDPEDPEAFETRGLPRMLDQIDAMVRASDEAGARWIYLNLTGGFKALLAYGTLQGLLYSSGGRFSGRLVLCYLFEETPRVIYMPRYPIGVDFQRWHRNAVRLRMVQDGYGLFRATLSSEMRSVLDEGNGAPRLYAFGRYLQQEYERQLEQDPLTIYSREMIRRLLPESLDDTAASLQRVLLRIVEPAAGLIWVGDKLPEAVDHARQHHQHLLEFAELFLTPVLGPDPAFLNARERFVLLAGILLHDCGHSLDYYTPPLHAKVMPLLAGEVRDFHHFLSARRIDDGEMAAELGWPGRDGFAQQSLDPNLHDAVLAVCLYHRRRMPYDAAAPDQNTSVLNDLVILWTAYSGVDSGEDVDLPPLSRHPLRPRLADAGIDLLKIVMLLRLIDGCDLQSRRAGPSRLVRQKLAMLRRDCDTASLRAQEARTAYLDALTLDTRAAARDLTAAFEHDDVADSAIRTRARRRCFELMRDGQTETRRLAALWTTAAEPIDQASMKLRQREHYIDHQCVQEVRVFLRPGTRWTFDVVLMPAAEMAAVLAETVPENGGAVHSRRKRIEDAVSSEYQSVAGYGARHCGWRVCYWWQEEYERTDGGRRPFYEPADDPAVGTERRGGEGR